MSYCSLFLIMMFAGSTSTVLNKAVTLYEMMHSPSFSIMFLICSTNSSVFLTWWMGLPTRSLCIFASSVATPYVHILKLWT